MGFLNFFTVKTGDNSELNSLMANDTLQEMNIHAEGNTLMVLATTANNQTKVTCTDNTDMSNEVTVFVIGMAHTIGVGRYFLGYAGGWKS